MDDIRQFLLKLAPPSYPYLHNDIHLRPATEDVSFFMCGGGMDGMEEQWIRSNPIHNQSMLIPYHTQ
jgi:hypothetical protein